MAAPPQRRPNRAVIAEQQAECYRLRLTGAPIRDIAKTLRMAPSTVKLRIDAEIAGKVLPLADEVRKMELDRLDRWLQKLDAQIADDRAVARNVEVAVKVSERRAKLAGADAPEKVEATVTEVTQEDIALAELVAEAKAASALAEAQLREQT